MPTEPPPTREPFALLLRAARFAAVKHRDQRRKDHRASPYINHPLEVAAVLAEHGVDDPELLAAALLHDTVEDTETTFEEIEAGFGRRVRELVAEVTDDKSLPSPTRKRLQIEHSPSASEAARRLKIADKICNVRDIAAAPPRGWPLERQRAYLDWAERVVAGCRGVNPSLEAAFDAALAAAREALSGERPVQ